MILICQNVQRLYFPACLLFEFSVNDNQTLNIEYVIKKQNQEKTTNLTIFDYTKCQRIFTNKSFT